MLLVVSFQEPISFGEWESSLLLPTVLHTGGTWLAGLRWRGCRPSGASGSGAPADPHRAGRRQPRPGSFGGLGVDGAAGS